MSQPMTQNFECGPVMVHEHTALQMEQFLLSLHMRSGPPEKVPICLQEKLCHGEYILQNPEQLSRPLWLDKMKKVVEDPLCVGYWDQSIANLKILHNHVSHELVKKMKFVPIEFPQNLVDSAKYLQKSKIKIYDFSFFGTLTPRRKMLIDRLTQAGMKVLVIRQFGFSKIIEESCCAKIMLNLHADDSQQIFETVRCGLFLDAGIPVISEDSLDSDPRLLAHFLPDTIVSVAQEALRKISQNNFSNQN